MISNSDGAEITLQGKGDIGLDIADVQAQVGVKSERNLGLKIIAESGHTPLMCISGIKPLNRALALLGGRPKNLSILSTYIGMTPAFHMQSDHEFLELDPEVSLEQAQHVGVPPSDLYHVAEFD